MSEEKTRRNFQRVLDKAPSQFHDELREILALEPRQLRQLAGLLRSGSKKKRARTRKGGGSDAPLRDLDAVRPHHRHPLGDRRVHALREHRRRRGPGAHPTPTRRAVYLPATSLVGGLRDHLGEAASRYLGAEKSGETSPSQLRVLGANVVEAKAPEAAKIGRASCRERV